MTLTLSATTDGAGTVALAVAGAAHVGATVYASNFTAGVDGWSTGTTGAHTAPSIDTSTKFGTPPVLRIGWSQGFLYLDQYATRTVTGLSIGQAYRVTADAIGLNSGSQCALSVAGIAPAPMVAVGPPGWTPLTFTFTATATSHAIRLQSIGSPTDNAVIYLRNVVVAADTAGREPLQLQRTDYNGTHPVRLPPNPEPDTTGALAVIDYEAALVGEITYVVRDGLGVTAAASCSDVGAGLEAGGVLGSAGLVNIVAIPVLAEYDDQRTYQQLTVDPKAVIGREDFTAALTGDYGWTKRQGTLTIRARQPNVQLSSQQSWQWCQDIVALYTAGRVVLLRQNTYEAGLDLYHVAKAVRVVPVDAYAGTPHRRGWSVEVDYVETGWPAGDLIGIDWTYADVAVGFLAYWNVAGAFATYADLLTGVP